MSGRAHIGLETKLASALLALGHVPYDHAKLMTAAQMISLYHFDHNKLHALEADDHFSNLAPMLIAPHRAKSRKDTGVVAKVKVLSKEHEEFRRKALAKPCGQKRERTGGWPQGRKIQNRGFQRERTR